MRLGTLGLVGLSAVLMISASGCHSSSSSNTGSSSGNAKPASALTQARGPVVPAATELKIQDLKVGTGAEAKAGETVTVYYTGWLSTGKKFDSSLDHGQPFSFALGAGQVIKGWDQGVAGMKVGGVRQLIVPPQLGYGANGAGAAIPPNATLVFDVQLLGVK